MQVVQRLALAPIVFVALELLAFCCSLPLFTPSIAAQKPMSAPVGARNWVHQGRILHRWGNEISCHVSSVLVGQKPTMRRVLSTGGGLPARDGVLGVEPRADIEAPTVPWSPTTPHGSISPRCHNQTSTDCNLVRIPSLR